MSPAINPGKDCLRCLRPMRGQLEKVADHPGTIAYGARGLCFTCYRLERNYQPPPPKHESTVEQNRASLIAYFRSRGRTITL